MSAQAPEASSPNRRPMHTRHIEMHAYEREDGLFEVEGRVVDRKPHDHGPIRGDRMVRAGEPIHNLSVRIVFDLDLVVHEVTTQSLAYPYAQCPEGGAALAHLKGLKMSAGWGAEVRRLLGGAASCTHLRELLMPMATTAFQSLSARRLKEPDRLDATGRPVKIDSCYAYGAERQLVQVHWPRFYRWREEDAPQSAGD